MRTPLRPLVAAALALAAAACDDPITTDRETATLSSAFATSLVGFENAPTTFDAAAFAATAWTPMANHQGGGLAGPGPKGGHHAGGMMGGIGVPFLGGGFHLGFGRGLYGDGHAGGGCTFSAASSRVECPPLTRNGITTTRSVAYATAGGAVQQAWDSVTTDRINTRVGVTGTRTRVTRRDSATTTVSHSAERTVTGLARGSTRITVNGSSAGRETSNGKDSVGTYTAVRVAGDTTRSVAIPVSTTGVLSSPASGSVTRVMTVTVTRGGSATSSSRREVVTYNGTDTATVVITKDGATTTCKLPLRGRARPTCS
jgi:hypothetical protein